MTSMARPKTAECESCGTTFSIASKGRIPTRCPDCRDGKPPVHDGHTVDVGPVTLDDEPQSVDVAIDDEPFVMEIPDTPPRHDKVVWDGSNLAEIREILDDGIEIDWHRANGRPYAEVHGEHRDWFMDVRPGDTVWHDAVIQNR